jgi:hypothetical protein
MGPPSSDITALLKATYGNNNRQVCGW